MSDALIDEHDAALFDLDGVVYLGPDPVPAAPDTIAELRRRGVKVGFVTNNAARSAEVVAQHLTDIGIPTEPSDVVTSGQAISDLAADTLPAGARVLIVGTESLRDEARARGLQPVESARDDPVAVIQGTTHRLPGHCSRRQDSPCRRARCGMPLIQTSLVQRIAALSRG